MVFELNLINHEFFESKYLYCNELLKMIIFMQNSLQYKSINIYILY
jgi:hypothetical protein